MSTYHDTLAYPSRRSPSTGLFAALQEAFFRAKRSIGHERLKHDLAQLPDHILVDIGIDPRTVPDLTSEIVERPDLVHHGLATRRWRTTVKP